MNRTAASSIDEGNLVFVRTTKVRRAPLWKRELASDWPIPSMSLARQENLERRTIREMFCAIPAAVTVAKHFQSSRIAHFHPGSLKVSLFSYPHAVALSVCEVPYPHALALSVCDVPYPHAVSLSVCEVPYPHAVSLSVCEVPDPHAVALSVSDFNRRQLALRPDLGEAADHCKELESLQKLLAFPEEVAMVMTEQEHQLFLEVPPPHYVRQVTVELSRNYHAHGTRTVEDLIRRFDEVRAV